MNCIGHIPSTRVTSPHLRSPSFAGLYLHPSCLCRCLPTPPSREQRPTSCVPSWLALQPALCFALPAISLPTRREALTRPRTSPRPPPQTWARLGPGPTGTPTSRSKVGCYLSTPSLFAAVSAHSQQFCGNHHHCHHASLALLLVCYSGDVLYLQ